MTSRATAANRCTYSPASTSIRNERRFGPIKLLARATRPSSLSVFRENVVALLYYGVARKAALRVVFLRRGGRRIERLECVGCRIVVECSPSPSAAVREPLAVLDHEINVVLGAWHRRWTGIGLLLFRDPMDFRHPGAVRERLPIVGNALPVGSNHGRIPYDHGDHALVLADRDHWPVLVSPELGERESIRYLHGVLVLRGNRHTSRENGNRGRNAETDQREFFHCRFSFVG